MTGFPDNIAAGLRNSKNISVVEVSRGALEKTPAITRQYFSSNHVCIIADQNTWQAAGQRLSKIFEAEGFRVKTHIWPAQPKPKPSVELATTLVDVLRKSDIVPVAVGSGVINDLVKYAAFILNRPYICVATAISMDGYTSAGAPLSEKGFKKTLQCMPAKVVIADLDVLRAAPREMTAWGYSDLAGKVPAGADWLLADALGVEPIDAQPWHMVQDKLFEYLSRPAEVAICDPDAMAELFAGLAMVGFAMEAHGSSRPASGADHQIAHLWEMEDLTHHGSKISHGSCVAIGALAVVQMYEWFLQQDILAINVNNLVRHSKSLDQKISEAKAAFGDTELFARSEQEIRAKHSDAAVLRSRLLLLKNDWLELKSKLSKQLMPSAEFRLRLKLAGAPYQPEMIGVTEDHLQQSILHARFLRSRYTILDVLDETKLLDAAVSELFGAGHTYQKEKASR